MEVVKVFMVDLPLRHHGLTAYGYDSNGELFYTIFINAKLNAEMQGEAYRHEIAHVDNHDFDEMLPLEKLEAERHGLTLCSVL